MTEGDSAPSIFKCSQGIGTMHLEHSENGVELRKTVVQSSVAIVEHLKIVLKLSNNYLLFVTR